MLRNFTGDLLSSVFRGPDLEGGAGGDVSDIGGVPDVGGGDHDGGSPADDGPSEPLTVREQLKRSIEEVREQDEKKLPRDKKTGRFGDRAPKAGAEAAPAEVPETPEAPKTTIAAPDSLPKEAKAEWDKAPEAIKAAFVKREQDMATGVAELKQRYELIDQAIAPHNDALRQMNATPADAVNRMFLWFKALAGTPAVAYPELAKNMGIDWNRLVAATTKQQAPAGGAAPAAPVDGNGNQGAPEIPEPVRQYVGQLESKYDQLVKYVQQIGGAIAPIQQTMATQNEQRINENLSIWSKDKPHFQDVRKIMGQLIESGVVPLKNGQVDLDTAYERAIYFSPEVRAKVLAEQQQANNQVQQDAAAAATTAKQVQADKARKASVSLPATAPGNRQPVTTAKKKPGERSSVRDSLKAAIADLRDQ